MEQQDEKIVVLSNITVTPFFAQVLDEKYREKDISLKTAFIPYQEYHNREYLNVFHNADTIMIWLNIEILEPEFEDYDYDSMKHEQKKKNIQAICQEIYLSVSEWSHARIIWVLFEDYYSRTSIATGYSGKLYVDELNVGLQSLLQNNITFIDLKHLIAEVGICNAYDIKNKYRWNYPYSMLLTKAVAAEVRKQYFINKGITKKCLVLDCDNVLWGGILSEEGLENIRLGSSGLGREYQAFQRFVLTLYKHGIILAVCSKNDLSDVLIMFRNHSEMILKEEHIACFQVNWEDKPHNIKRIAEILNISLDSMVFVDDSLVEIEAVKAILPEVSTILYQREKMYEQFSCFNLNVTMDYREVAKRNVTYRTNSLRQNLKSQYDNYRDYLNALEMEIDIHKVLPVEYARVAELTQRANKCTNGKRYTVSDIKKRMSGENTHLYSVFLSDRYSDLGLVGVLGVKDNMLEIFCLSCRALGRNVENRMSSFIKEQFQIKKIEFENTGKNKDFSHFLCEYFSVDWSCESINV